MDYSIPGSGAARRAGAEPSLAAPELQRAIAPCWTVRWNGSGVTALG